MILSDRPRRSRRHPHRAGSRRGIPDGQPERPVVPPANRPGHARPRVVRWTLGAGDAIALALAAICAQAVSAPQTPGTGMASWALLAVPSQLLLFKLYGLYDRDGRRLAHSTADDVPAVFHALVVGVFGLTLVLVSVGSWPLRPVQGAVLFGIGFLAVLALRVLTRTALRRWVPAERVLLLGTGADARLLSEKISGRAGADLDLVGYLADDGTRDEAPATGLRRLGTLRDLDAITRGHRVARIVVASSALDSDVLTEVLREASRLGTKVSVLPSLADVLGPATEVDDLEGITLLSVNPVRFSRSSWLLKRTLDITLSGVSLAVLLPLLPFVALAIKLDSPGPVLFSQPRRGRAGRVFRMHKLRTMVPDAETRLETLRSQSAHSAWLLVDHDPRVTRLGRFLRRTSLDELPQLWNVLIGEMSLVGPRPMPLDTDRHIKGWARRRLDLTPGITGLWQVLGRTSITFEEMIKLDYVYVTNWSVWRDVQLLLRTVSVVLSRRGAN